MLTYLAKRLSASALILVGVSILTSLYGHYVEKRPIS